MRRESFEPVDLFYAHIGGMDAFAHGLKIAAAIRADGALEKIVKQRPNFVPARFNLAQAYFNQGEYAQVETELKRVLELQPQLGEDGRTLVFASESAEQKGNQRKTTGSYYTPDSLVQALLDSALDPVLDRVEAEGFQRV